MIPTLIYVVGVIRRALKKAGRTMSMLAEVFFEALEQTHAARKKYPFAE